MSVKYSTYIERINRAEYLINNYDPSKHGEIPLEVLEEVTGIINELQKIRGNQIVNAAGTGDVEAQNMLSHL